ncbi:MAG: adenylosuccinate lyase [Anaerolineae bacterium]
MSTTFTHDQYLSPFAWRYGSDEMRRLWSEVNKRRLWRRIWVALAAAQSRVGLVSEAELADIAAHQNDVDIERAEAIEAEIRHDLMAEVRTYAEQCPIGGGKIHLGATSMDVEDNADALRLRQAAQIIRGRLADCLLALADQIERFADVPCMGFTHIQPAEPTTIGYRLSQYAQDFFEDLERLDQVIGGIRGKGLKGAVGTAASYERLLQGSGVSATELERWLMDDLGLPAYPVATQTYPRKQDWVVVNVLAGIGASAHKFAFDMRVLQSPPIGEWSEPFGKRQVGSSAMPFKRNPITAETTCSLSRYVAALPPVLWQNAANSLLERTLDDSANRRATLADAFLATDHVLACVHRLVTGLTVNEAAVTRNMQTYGPFAATEVVLMEAVKAGADRQLMHEVLRENAMCAWSSVQAGAPNPLAELLAADERITSYVSPDEVRASMHAESHVGIAAERSRAFACTIRDYLK